MSYSYLIWFIVFRVRYAMSSHTLFLVPYIRLLSARTSCDREVASMSCASRDIIHSKMSGWRTFNQVKFLGNASCLSSSAIGLKLDLEDENRQPLTPITPHKLIHVTGSPKVRSIRSIPSAASWNRNIALQGTIIGALEFGYGMSYLPPIGTPVMIIDFCCGFGLYGCTCNTSIWRTSFSFQLPLYTAFIYWWPPKRDAIWITDRAKEWFSHSACQMLLDSKDRRFSQIVRLTTSLTRTNSFFSTFRVVCSVHTIQIHFGAGISGYLVWLMCPSFEKERRFSGPRGPIDEHWQILKLLDHPSGLVFRWRFNLRHSISLRHI